MPFLLEYVSFNTNQKSEIYTVASLKKMDVDELMKYKKNPQQKTLLTKSDFLYILRCCKRNIILDLHNTYYSKKVNQINNELILNKSIAWTNTFDIQLDNNIDGYIEVPEFIKETNEVEIYRLINLFNKIDWKNDELTIADL